jgi:hypothetical protein
MNRFLVISFMITLSSVAFAGGQSGNGGDACEARIKSISQDIASWINDKGSANLQLPNGVTERRYNSSMGRFIREARAKCTNRVLTVDGFEKTCVNTSDKKFGTRVICNRLSFLQSSEDDQYRLVHHEFAGLSGFEVTLKGQSNYEISDQLTGFLETTASRRLSVKKPSIQRSNEIQKYFSNFAGKYEVVSCEEISQDAVDQPVQRVDCGKYKIATLFFGDNYSGPTSNIEAFFINLAGNPDNTRDFQGSVLALEKNDPGQNCTTCFGLQYCTHNSVDASIQSSKIRADGGLTYVEWFINYRPKGGYVFSTSKAVLRKID